MSWGKFFVKTFGVGLVLWALMFYAYGNFFLFDSVVPQPGIEISEWLGSYYMTGLCSVVAGFICCIIWYAMGEAYDGRSAIEVKYWVMAAISLVLGIACYFVMLMDAVEGTGAAGSFVVIISPLLYIISSACASPDAVRSVPPISL